MYLPRKKKTSKPSSWRCNGVQIQPTEILDIVVQAQVAHELLLRPICVMIQPIHAERIKLRHTCAAGTQTEATDSCAYSVVEMLANDRIPQSPPSRKLWPVIVIIAVSAYAMYEQSYEARTACERQKRALYSAVVIVNLQARAIAQPQPRGSTSHSAQALQAVPSKKTVLQNRAHAQSNMHTDTTDSSKTTNWLYSSRSSESHTSG